MREEHERNFWTTFHGCTVYKPKIDEKIDVPLKEELLPIEESKEDQPFVLVPPPPVPHTFDDSRVVTKELPSFFNDADTFVLDVEIMLTLILLKMASKLQTLKVGMPHALPKTESVPFIWDHSKLVDVT